MNLSLPLARQDQLTIQHLDDEVIVYDGTNAQASVLNRTAAVIWSLCDGKTSAREIAQRASAQLHAPVDETLVWYTVAQLSKKGLMAERTTVPMNFKGMSRREFLRAGAIGAAVVLPVVVTMTAPKAADAATGKCPGTNVGDPCDPITCPCTPPLWCNGTCQPT